ncbi:MAG: hypothetical protein OEN48_11860 [Betaproteobacteria bacterium]|nr:hypothetical protein [Betaproteobacteria bacterium]
MMPLHPLSANFLLSQWLPSHWANHSEGKRRAGVTPDPAGCRIARTIFVADGDKVARRYGMEDPASPYRFYWQQLRTKLGISKRLGVFKTHQAQDDREIHAPRQQGDRHHRAGARPPCGVQIGAIRATR